MELLTRHSSLKISTGPSGRAIAEPIESDLLDGLYQHLTMERQASAHYFAVSLWFAERELRGFSKFFRQECLNEHEHAEKFAEYLIARGQTVVLHDLPAPNQNWTSVEDIMKVSFQMESDVTTSLQQLYSVAERSSDVRTTVFLDPTVESQLSSEDEFAYLLGRVKFANNEPSALLIIDGELSKQV